jgi:hypothetical protein
MYDMLPIVHSALTAYSDVIPGVNFGGIPVKVFTVVPQLAVVQCVITLLLQKHKNMITLFTLLDWLRNQLCVRRSKQGPG